MFFFSSFQHVFFALISFIFYLHHHLLTTERKENEINLLLIYVCVIFFNLNILHQAQMGHPKRVAQIAESTLEIFVLHVAAVVELMDV